MKTDIERVLYYLKSRDTWENYVIARHSLSDIVKLCNKRKYQFCKEDNGLEIKLEEIGKIFEKKHERKSSEREENMALLKIQDVCKYYGNESNITKALDKVNFEIQEGEFVGIMGASGSGKTTMLNCISTIDTVTSGHIFYDKTDITEMRNAQLAEFRRKNLGFVFQDFNLLDTLTVEENISLALTINGEEGKDISKRVESMAQVLGIGHILNRFPYEISGGQKQRCACARALINHPKLILADEPTGALDSKSAQLLLETMEKMNQDLGATILMVTHDVFSASYCQRILFLKDGNLFKELNGKGKNRRDFYNEILNVLVLLGGEVKGAC